MTTVAAGSPARRAPQWLSAGTTAAATLTVLVVVSVLGSRDALASDLPALVVEPDAPAWQGVAAFGAALLLVTATWQGARYGPAASVGVAVAAGGWLLPGWAGWAWLPAAARSGLLAASPLVVAGIAQVGLGWSADRGRSESRILGGAWAAVVVAVVVHLATYDPFADAGCLRTCEHSRPVLATVIGTDRAAAGAAVLTMTAAVVVATALLLRMRRGSAALRSVCGIALLLAAADVILRLRASSGPDAAARWRFVAAGLELGAVAITGSAAVAVFTRTWHVRRALLRLRDELAAPAGTGGRGRYVREVHFAVPGEVLWVDARGRGVELPPGSRAQLVRAEGAEPVLRFVLHPRAPAGVGLAALTPAMRLTLENTRLAAVVQARLHQVQVSRQRIVATRDVERRRIERDLHDGAQQRLVSAALHVRLALSSVPPSIGERLRAAEAQILDALRRLRDLTHAMSPRILTEEGLEAAIEELVAASGVPTTLTMRLDAAPSGSDAMAVYAAVSAALDNIAEHAGASGASVVIDGHHGRLTVRVLDDGHGGAVLGPGLTDVADRLDAAGGRLHLTSPLGQGTVLVAEIPCAS